VTLVANENARRWADEHGFEFHPLFSQAEIGEILANPDFWHPVKGPYAGAKWGSRYIDRQCDQLMTIAAQGQCVLVANPGIFAARMVSEKLGRPLITLLLQPWMIPSISAPPIMPGGMTLPHWAPRPVGRLYWSAVHFVGDMLVRSEINRTRTRLGLPRIRRVLEWWVSADRVLGLFPDWYGRPQADWPGQVRLSGFPMYDGAPAGPLADEVREYCDADSPPLVFTFGTGMMHAAAVFHDAIKVIGRLQRRAILLTRFREQLPETLPPNVRHFEFVPLRGLLPHVAAIVHHGGIGTTAQALAAGVPQLITPWSWDQPDNAHRLERLGVARSIPVRRVTPDRMAVALESLLTPERRARCREVAATFSNVDSLDVAADQIEEICNGPAVPTSLSRPG
jgi:UDP:flavonoid glycosyltransferase YjiC (YdhE family)